MKFSDFDKHIKDNAARDLEAPSEFDWENMDIAIPEQKSRKPLLIWFFTTAILVAGSAYYFSTQGTIDNNQFEKQETTKTAIAVVEDSQHEIEQSNTNEENNISQSLISNDDLVQIKGEEQQAQQEKLKSFNNRDALIEQISDLVVHAETPISGLEQEESIDFEGPIERVEVINELQLSEQVTTLDYKNLNIEQKDLPQLPSFSRRKSMRLINDGWTLLTRVNYTKNHFQSSNLEYLDALKEADLGDWSPSLSVRKAFALTPDLFASVGLSYHQLHTVFSYNQYLGYEDVINAAGSPERIHKTRVVYQNNYSNIAELNLGLGKTYPLASQLDIQFQVGVNGGYQFSDKGKTLNTSLEIVDKEFTSSLSRLILSTSADAHIVYKMNQMKLLVGGGFSKFLTSLNTIDNTMVSNRPNLFFMDIGIGYQF